MPASDKKGDIRSTKTVRALNAAMFSLLEKHSFRKISVRDICEEALISRATFYAHFADKYDFLRWWIINAWPDNLMISDSNDSDETMINIVNQFVSANRIFIRNLFIDVDRWSLDALFDALCITLHLTTDKTTDGLENPKYIVLSNFYIGGMIHYISWQVKNDFPQDVSMMNEYLTKIIKAVQRWNQ